MFPIKDDNPLRSTPWLTIAIIAVNVLVFLWQLGQGPARDYGLLQYAMVPRALAEALGFHPAVVVPRDIASRDLLKFYLAYDPAVPVAFTVVTSMFMHGGWLHLFGNMWSFWIFGNNIEDETGPGGFIVFYLACGIAAALTQALLDLSSPVPVVGASGAIAGVLGAYLLRFPHARILTLVPFFFVWLVWIPAGVWLVVWFLMQVLSSGLGGGVAWHAHIGGFVTGMILGPVFMGARRRRIRRLSF